MTRSSSILSAAAAAFAALSTTGCGITPSPAAPATTVLQGIHGSVFGGRQPISGASLQLYQAGATGYGAGATGLLASNITTDATGQFNITGTYACTNGTQLYLASVGGDPTTGNPVYNNQAVLLAGLGQCETVKTGLPVNINEVTTVATVWALAPFMNPTVPAAAVLNEIGTVDASGINVGAPASNSAGLAAAFADINTLATVSTGYPTNSTANVTVPTQEMYLLANILAGCVDGDGTQSACTKLFTYATPPSGTAPADVFGAALDIARNPGNNVTSLLNLSLPSGPYSSTISSISDWTLGVTYTGGGISSPSAVAVDAKGNTWIANSASNSLTELQHNGTVLSGTSGFTDASLNAPRALAIDTTGNIWVANQAGNSITKFASDGSVAAASPFTGGGLSSPTSINFDGTGNAWIANSGNNSVSEFTSAGTPLSPANTGYTSNGASSPVGVAVNPR